MADRKNPHPTSLHGNYHVVCSTRTAGVSGRRHGEKNDTDGFDEKVKS
jgi:hypothetical protein